MLIKNDYNPLVRYLRLASLSVLFCALFSINICAEELAVDEPQKVTPSSQPAESLPTENTEKTPVKPADENADTNSDVKPEAESEESSEQNSLVEKVVVLGSKMNLMSAQAIKRDADTMVDAVSAEDIRVVQNRSVLDAVQRLPGIALERFSAPDDPDRFSTEASGITIRGMSQSRSEFNGRDIFSANQGRGLNYKDIPPELMGSIEIYKNQTADMIEGGIGGTVVLNTRKPFDMEDSMKAFSVDYSMGDIAQQWSPTYSMLFSDRWDTSKGEFGLLLNYTHSTLYGESHGIQSDAYLPYYAQTVNIDPEMDPGAAGSRAQDFLGEDEDGDGLGDGIVWVPSAGNILKKMDERNREGMAGVLQYKNPSDTFKATLEYVRSDSKLIWNERAIKYQGGFHTIDDRKTRPLRGTFFSFDEQGLFESGTLTNGNETWRVGNTGYTRVPQRLPVETLEWDQWGHKTQMDSRLNDTESLVEDTSINFLWQATDKLSIEGDAQWVKAETANDDVSVHLHTWANMQYDVSGSVPSITYLSPWNGVRDATRVNDILVGGLDDNIWDTVKEDGEYLFPGFGGDPMGDHNYFQDENSYLWRSAMDHYERSEGDSQALRLDAIYELDRGIITSLKAGLRQAVRQQVVRSTQWNWGALTPEWSQGVVVDYDLLPEGEEFGSGLGWLPDVSRQQDGYEHIDWSGFMGGGIATIEGNRTLHATEELIRSVSGSHPERVLLKSSGNPNSWEPYPTRNGLDTKYGLFRPSEMNTTTETRNAFYLRLDFAGDTERKYSGNIGLRYLTMKRDAKGAVLFPLIEYDARDSRRPVPAELSLPLQAEQVDAYINQQVADGLYLDYDKAFNSVENNWMRMAYNYLSDEERGFTIGGLGEDGRFQHTDAQQQAQKSFDMLLPSFNIKVDLTSSLVARFALAKTVAFPDMQDVRNRAEFTRFNASGETSDDLTVKFRTVTVADAPDAEVIESARINTEADQTPWVGGGGNPQLKPMESVQYDFSLEWYFSDAGQLSAALFHKNLDDYFAQGVIYRDFTHPSSGVTQTTAVTGTRNGGNSKLDGIEMTYHQFYTGWLEGFGLQVSYTYIDANSVPNNEKDVSDEQWFDSIYEDTGIRVNFDKLPLEGQSEEILNVVGMYETEHITSRLSYNWRSKYLLTTRDVISKAPQWYDDHGELDASFLYHINDRYTVGLDAKNVTNARSDIIMILNDDLLSTGRSWFEADRRIALVFRAEL